MQERTATSAPAGAAPGLLRLELFYSPPGSGPAARPDMGPLPPHVCSLALLPTGAAGYVPPGVRWLMEEGSPVADIYRECPVGGPGGGRVAVQSRFGPQLNASHVNDSTFGDKPNFKPTPSAPDSLPRHPPQPHPALPTPAGVHHHHHRGRQGRARLQARADRACGGREEARGCGQGRRQPGGGARR
jgi:hypothetical protein